MGKMINVTSPAKRAQIVTELRTLRDLSDSAAPHCSQLVRMLDVFFHDGYVCVALEHMDGGCFERVQQRRLKVPEDVLTYILREALSGLHVLHSRFHIIHRDIKPGNLLFNSTGEVKLGDFGISKALQDHRHDASTYIGTALYMSPERLQGRKYDSTCDVWSLGLMALELAVGAYPYDTTGGLHSFICHVINELPGIPRPEDGFSPAFCDFLLICLRLDPSERPSAQTLLEHPYIATAPGPGRFVEWAGSQ